MLFARRAWTVHEVKLLFNQQRGAVAHKKSSTHILDNESYPQMKRKYVETMSSGVFYSWELLLEIF